MTNKPLAMLGGLTADEFMRHFWQKKPLLVRQAFAGIKPPVSSADLKKLSKRDDVQARLIWQENNQWQLEHGPFGELPGAKEPKWTLLIQSLDIHSDAASQLLHQFNFVPAARLDDLMASIATRGGGVGPHFDSYDVFLIQAQGQRHWKFGQQKDLTLIDGLPLKILKNFKPQQEAVLEPGDMLYLPPQAAHDGIAVTDDCMTLSVGFRAPDMASLAQGMLEAAAEQIAAREHGATSPMADPPLPGPDLSARFIDPRQPAVTEPAQLPDTLIQASIKAVRSLKFDAQLASRYLGCWLTEPNPLAVFEPAHDTAEFLAGQQLVLDRRSRMLYRDQMLFINGELVPIKPNALLMQLANERRLCMTTPLIKKMSAATRDCLLDWLDAGWVHIETNR